MIDFCMMDFAHHFQNEGNFDLDFFIFHPLFFDHLKDHFNVHYSHIKISLCSYLVSSLFNFFSHFPPIFSMNLNTIKPNLIFEDFLYLKDLKPIKHL